MILRKTTLIVIVCAVALGAAVYYWDWKRGQAEKPAEDTSKPAFSLQAADVRSLTLARPAQPQQPAIRLEKRDAKWVIIQPIEADADEPVVESMVEEIVGASISQTEPGTPERRKAYGLDPPQGSIEFALQSGAKHTLALGNKDFTDSDVYAVIDGGSNVALLPGVLASRPAMSVQELRDRRVLRLEASDVQRIEIHNPHGVIIASRKKDSPEDWVLEAPKEQSGKNATSWKIAAAINGLRAEEVIDHPPAGPLAQVAVPAVTALLTAKDGRRVTVRISKASGDFVYARAEAAPQLYKLKKQVLENWNLKPADLIP